MSLAAERNLSPFTVRNYGSDLRHYFAWLKAQQIALLGDHPAAFPGYIAAMQKAGAAQGSVTRRATPELVLQVAAAHRRDEGRPQGLVSGPKSRAGCHTSSPSSDITDLIAAADEDTPADLCDRAILELPYGSGLRVSEAATLDTNAVDLDQRTVIVAGKGNKQRRMVMGEPARGPSRAICDGRGSRNEAAYSARDRTDSAPAVTPTSRGALSESLRRRLSQRGSSSLCGSTR